MFVFSVEVYVSTSLIAAVVALVLVSLFLVSIGALSLVSGIFHTYLDRPRFDVLKSKKFNFGLAFAFKWNASKDPSKMDTIRVRLFNPEGIPTQVEVARTFVAQTSSFALEVDMGEQWPKLLGAQGFLNARISVIILSSKEGVSFEFEMSGKEFEHKINSAILSAEEVAKQMNPSVDGPEVLIPEVPERSFIVDKLEVAPMQLAIASNPVFSAYFSNVGGGDSKGAGTGAAAAVQENFKVAKVWIEPGCIVCNACEDTYPEVFEVLADTCIVRPNYPLDDGLKVQEAAEGCPVEVIKFAKA